jgi:hypothetical protein
LLQSIKGYGGRIVQSRCTRCHVAYRGIRVRYTPDRALGAHREPFWRAPLVMSDDPSCWPCMHMYI